MSALVNHITGVKCENSGKQKLHRTSHWFSWALFLFLYLFQNSSWCSEYRIPPISPLSMSQCEMTRGFQRGKRSYNPSIKYTLNDAVMQTWLGVQDKQSRGVQLKLSNKVFGGRGCETVSSCLSLFLPHSLTHPLKHPHTGSPQGAIKKSPPIYQLSATKPLIQQTLFLSQTECREWKKHKNSNL